jgi:competence protein ComEA
MEGQIVKENVEEAVDAAGSRSLWARVRGAVADSAWGSLVGKGFVYAIGFVLLAAVGSGRIHCLSARSRGPVPEANAAAAAPPPPSELVTMNAPAAAAAPTAVPTCSPDAGAATDAGGEGCENQEANAADAGAESGRTKEGKVVLNRASEEDLRHLPGIGATRARAILALRAKIGRFSRVEDLLRVKGIGRRSLARLRPLVQIE